MTGRPPTPGTIRARENFSAVVDAWLAGKSKSQIALDYGCPRNIIAAILEDAGVQRPRPRPSGVSVAKARAAYRRHGSFEAAGRALGCSGNTVRRRLGITGRQLPAVSPAEVVRRYEDGATLAEIGEMCGLTAAGAAWRLRSLGATIRPPYSRPTALRARADVHRLCRLYQDGVSSDELALVYGTTPQTVAALLEEQHVPIRSGGQRSAEQFTSAAVALQAEGLFWAATKPLQRFVRLHPGFFSVTPTNSQDLSHA